MSYRSWCFTLNNWTEDEYNFIYEWRDDVTLLVVGKEIGAQGCPHLQAVVTFKRTFRLAGLKELLPRAHWEPCRDREASIKYCKKDDDYFEIVNDLQGKRTDIERAVETLRSSGLNAVATEHSNTFVKFHGGFRALADQLESGRLAGQKPEVHWYWGSTGSGKTRRVIEKECDLWISGDDLKWFDGYQGQEAALLDDFRDDMCKLQFLLRLLDRYPLRVQVKGGHTQWKPLRIYITSSKPPEQMYQKTGENIQQLIRRIDKVEVFAVQPDFVFVE